MSRPILESTRLCSIRRLNLAPVPSRWTSSSTPSRPLNRSFSSSLRSSVPAPRASPEELLRRKSSYLQPIPDFAALPKALRSRPSAAPSWFRSAERHSALRSQSRLNSATDITSSTSHQLSDHQRKLVEEAENDKTASGVRKRRNEALVRMYSSLERVPAMAGKGVVNLKSREMKQLRPRAVVREHRRILRLAGKLKSSSSPSPPAVTSAPSPVRSAAPEMVASPVQAKARGLLAPELRGPVPLSQRIVFRTTAPLRRSVNVTFLVMICISFIGVVYGGMLMNMGPTDVYPALQPSVSSLALILLLAELSSAPLHILQVRQGHLLGMPPDDPSDRLLHLPFNLPHDILHLPPLCLHATGDDTVLNDFKAELMSKV